jgi:zinc D-Ala-D-Ala dipeptidase
MYYKIVKHINFLLLSTLFFFNSVSAQHIPLNTYGLPVITQKRQYAETVIKDSSKRMVELPKWIPGIILDLRYAGNNNFTGHKLYPQSRAFLRLPAALALAKVQAKLKEKGLGLKIYDAYRPYAATKLMWELVKDERYAASPKKGSGHNRGAAVDLSLVDLKTGKELAMPTAFDDFSEKSHHDYMQLPQAALENRQLLKTVMEENGFKALSTEWWHYYLPDAQRFELMDLSFKELVNASRKMR